MVGSAGCMLFWGVPGKSKFMQEENYEDSGRIAEAGALIDVAHRSFAGSSFDATPWGR
ncbi:protein of unknown function [Maridesulfovibrio hydrothermalis AM13 = DSM 14728]|uniref:Uncharacterized protein n=1 Tax=Maridesulfovibrio hydrothermalis AM13 = DSM 14728 TaxID=1121451 RepID=L0RB17_9BACT|nr:protein of unknown function [Maridesulfovibrio hydrothermalis AM13 = DSM 14728]